MFRHVVMIKLTAEATEADRDAIVAGLEGLPAVIPEIRSYTIGADAGLAEGNFDLVVVGEFDDADGYQTYAQHPVHLDVITTRIKPFLAARAAVQHQR